MGLKDFKAKVELFSLKLKSYKTASVFSPSHVQALAHSVTAVSRLCYSVLATGPQ